MFMKTILNYARKKPAEYGKAGLLQHDPENRQYQGQGYQRNQ